MIGHQGPKITPKTDGSHAVVKVRWCDMLKSDSLLECAGERWFFPAVVNWFVECLLRLSKAMVRTITL